MANRSDTLLPGDSIERARAISWVFAALNSIEPGIQQLTEIDLFPANEEWAQLRRPMVEGKLIARLGQLAAWLEDGQRLENEFTVGDLMIATVLGIPRQTQLVAGHPELGPYLSRYRARPAYSMALADHMAAHEATSIVLM